MPTYTDNRCMCLCNTYKGFKLCIYPFIYHPQRVLCWAGQENLDKEENYCRDEMVDSGATSGSLGTSTQPERETYRDVREPQTSGAWGRISDRSPPPFFLNGRWDISEVWMMDVNLSKYCCCFGYFDKTSHKIFRVLSKEFIIIIFYLITMYMLKSNTKQEYYRTHEGLALNNGTAYKRCTK